MGRLGLGTVQGFIDFSSLSSELEPLNPDLLQSYIDRSEAYLDRLGPYCPSNGGGYTEDMKVAVYKLAEMLFVISAPLLLKANVSGFDSEKIGTYSYSRGIWAKNPGNFDPIKLDPELANIVFFYKCSDVPLINTTIVFRELDPSLITGKRDYKDVFDNIFDFASDYGIRSGSNQARNIH